jgi:hypothetical protein
MNFVTASDLSRTRPFQVLALKCVSVDQLTLRTLNYLNSAMLTALKEECLNDGSLSAETYRLGIAPVGVLVANPPVGHLQSLLLGNVTIAPFKDAAKCIQASGSKRAERVGPRKSPFENAYS